MCGICGLASASPARPIDVDRLTAMRDLLTHRGPDGFAQMWIDGTKVVDVSREACGTAPPLGEKVWCTNADLDMLFVNDGIRMVRWGGVHTDNPAQGWTYDIDDFSWWITP